MKNMNVLFSVILSVGLVGCGGGGQNGGLYGTTKPSSATTGSVTSAVTGSMSSNLLDGTDSNSFKSESTSSNSGHSFEDAHKTILERIAKQKIDGMGTQEIIDKFMKSDSFTVTISGSYSCTGGGSIAMDGNMTFTLSSSGPNNFTLNYSMSMDETLSACKVNGYTMNGDIGVHTATGQFNVNIVDPLADSTYGASYYFPISGTLDITGPDVSFTGCVIDVVSTMVMNGSMASSMSFSSSTTGSVCGSTVNESYSFTYTAD